MASILQNLDPLWANRQSGWITDNKQDSFTFSISKISKTLWPRLITLINPLYTTIGLYVDPTLSLALPYIRVRAIIHKDISLKEDITLGFVPKRISKDIYKNLTHIQYGVINNIHIDFSRKNLLILQVKFFYKQIQSLKNQISLTQAILQEKLAIQEEMRQNEVLSLRV